MLAKTEGSLRLSKFYPITLLKYISSLCCAKYHYLWFSGHWQHGHSNHSTNLLLSVCKLKKTEVVDFFEISFIHFFIHRWELKGSKRPRQVLSMNAKYVLFPMNASNSVTRLARFLFNIWPFGIGKYAHQDKNWQRRLKYCPNNSEKNSQNTLKISEKGHNFAKPGHTAHLQTSCDVINGEVKIGWLACMTSS